MSCVTVSELLGMEWLFGHEYGKMGACKYTDMLAKAASEATYQCSIAFGYKGVRRYMYVDYGCVQVN